MKIKLLIVDDEPSIRDLLSRHFRYHDYDVATASDGSSALEHMANHKVDILITDILMPGMDGIELTTRVREEYPLVRMIVVTGYVTLTNALSAMQNGVDALIPKPIISMEVLSHAVGRSAEILQDWVDQLAALHVGEAHAYGASRWLK